MEQPSGAEQEAAWRAGFQRKYIGQLAAILRRGRIERAASGLARSRAVKLAADLSLAMTARGRTVWRRAILRKCLFRLNKSRCQRQSVVKSRMNSQRSASGKNTKPYKMTFSSRKSLGRLLKTASGSGTGIRSHGNEEAGCNVASRMETLKALVPGSHGLDPPVFLKEAANYIEALKMQVQAMQALTDWCSNYCAHTCHV